MLILYLKMFFAIFEQPLNLCVKIPQLPKQIIRKLHFYLRLEILDCAENLF
jgi:hypothetical protein